MKINKKINKKSTIQLIVDFINNWQEAARCYGFDNKAYERAILNCIKIENILFESNKQNELYEVLNENNILNYYMRCSR